MLIAGEIRSPEITEIDGDELISGKRKARLPEIEDLDGDELISGKRENSSAGDIRSFAATL